MMEGTSRKTAAIPRWGGKFRLARYIVPIVESFPHTHFIEPCAGGGSVFFWRAPDASRVEVLNDTCNELVCLYRAMKLYPDDLLYYLDTIPYSETIHASLLAIPIPETPLTIAKDELLLSATATYMKLCAGFGNKLSDVTMNRDRGLTQNFALTWDNKKTALGSIIHRLSRTYIEHSDMQTCIKRWDSPNALFYIDPPYPGTDNREYAEEPYTLAALENLMALLATIKGTYILSNSWFPSIAAMSTSVLSRTLANQTHRQNKTRMECLYLNKPLSTTPPGWSPDMPSRNPDDSTYALQLCG